MDGSEGKKIILFDGVCNLCNGAVQWIIRRDQKDVFRFASLQSEIGRELTRSRQIDTDRVDSIILIDPGVAYYIKSDAALEIARELRGYRILPGLFGWIPKRIRDGVYDLVARNRYRMFGKKQECMVPTPELKGKFLESA
ncbi:MAG: thiol-disulfide oxidoreductase DCC family protein [Robiginitalea sp.]|nr:thiol-disulfide oxidoreductase DCC family protein [Robiginitalea sp.]